MSNFPQATLTFAQQIGRMSCTYTGFRVKLGRNRAVWIGDLQPTAASETYTVKVEYVLRSRPVVWVLRPLLRSLTTGEKIPHMFSNGSVCLHLHGEWTPQKFISHTIVPWLSLWLLHYEVWHATGEWHGGGHEPQGFG